MVWYCGSMLSRKYSPRSCTHPSKSDCVILFGVFSSGLNGFVNFTGASSTVTRADVTLNEYGPGAAISNGCGEVELYCTTSVPPFSTYFISFGCASLIAGRAL